MKKQNSNLLIVLVAISSLILLSFSFSKVTAAPKNKETASNHRSVVSTYVHSLLDIADREGGIGQQVRIIAQQQNDSLEETIETITQIQNRNRIRTFLIGSDYKNLGALRSEMVKTRNRIEQLKRLVDKTELPEDKTELQNQITSLEGEYTKITDFIKLNEDKFSLFGWVAKLLNK